MIDGFIVERGLVGLVFSKPARLVSSLPQLHEVVDGVVVLEVGEDFDRRDIISFLREVEDSLGLGRLGVLLTAARLPRSAGIEVVHAQWETVVLATLGPRPVACTRMSRLYEPLRATINIVVATEAPLRREAMIDLLRVAAEAKTAAVNELLPWCRRRPLGTVTDAVLVATPAGTPGELLTAGAATTIGGLVADAVESLVVELWRRTLTPRERLEALLGPYARLLDLDMLADLVSRKPDTLALLLAARHLDLHQEYGTLPGELRTPTLLAEATKRLENAQATRRGHLETLLEEYRRILRHRQG